MDREVVVVPVNGFGNRLKAMASGALLSQMLGVGFRVAWMPEASILPADFHDLFAPDQDFDVIDYQDLRALIALASEMPPKTLSRIEESETICLRGYHRGEQYFMADLARIVSQVSWQRIVIWSGGDFVMPSSARPAASGPDSPLEAFKQDFYRRLRFSEPVNQMLLEGSGTARIVLHLRYGDRSSTAPTDRRIARSLRPLLRASRRGGVGPEWYVASDDALALERWSTRLRAQGKAVTQSGHRILGREAVDAVRFAVAEWNLLATAKVLVHFTGTTFAEEAAAVCRARGGQVLAITPSLSHRFGRRLRVSLRHRSAALAGLLIGRRP